MEERRRPRAPALDPATVAPGPPSDYPEPFRALVAGRERRPRGGAPGDRVVRGVPRRRGHAHPRLQEARLAVRDHPHDDAEAGPHRADLVFQLAGNEARTSAAQGQQRTLVLALKLAEVDYLTTRLSCTPILLLDDVSSELDATRTNLLFEAVTQLGTQVWVSTTGSSPIPSMQEIQIFQVNNGRIQSLPTS